MKVLTLELYDKSADDMQLMGIFQSEATLDAYVRESWTDPRALYGFGEDALKISLYELYDKDGVYSEFDLYVTERIVR